MRILVTGGAGFIGSHLVDSLIAVGHEVRVIDNLFSGNRDFVHPSAVFFERDISDFESIKDLFEGVDTVCHLAALVSVPLSVEKPELSYKYNVLGTENVLKCAVAAGVRKFIFASSCAVYGENGRVLQSEDAPLRPQSPYAKHKLMGENFCKKFAQENSGFIPVIFRFFNVYGSLRQSSVGGYASVMCAFLRRHFDGQPLQIYGDGNQTRDFVHWSDIVSALLAAIRSETVLSGSVFNIGSGIETSVNEVAGFFGGTREYLPARNGEMRRACGEIIKIRRELAWEPAIPLEKGMRKYIDESFITT